MPDAQGFAYSRIGLLTSELWCGVHNFSKSIEGFENRGCLYSQSIITIIIIIITTSTTLVEILI